MGNQWKAFGNIPRVKLYFHIKEKLNEKYGSDIDTVIENRLGEEWSAICSKELEEDYYNLAVLIDWLKKAGYPYMLTNGRCFITYLFDTTSPNPLPPHKYCLHCKKVYWCNDKVYKLDGFDIEMVEDSGIEVFDILPKYIFCDCQHGEFEYDGHDLLWQIPINPGHESDTEIEVLLPKGIEEKVAEVFGINDLAIISISRELLIGKLKLKFALSEAKQGENYYKNNVTSSCGPKVLEKWRELIGISEDSDLPKPRCFNALLAVYSFKHSTRLWNFRTKFLVEKCAFRPETFICFQEDIYKLYTDHGFSPQDSYTALLAHKDGLASPFRIDDIYWTEDNWKYLVLMAAYIPKYICSKGEILEKVFYSIRLQGLAK